MNEVKTDVFEVSVTKSGKFLLKVFDSEKFRVIAFMIDQKTYGKLLSFSDDIELYMKCYTQFNSNFGNLVLLAVGDEVIYSAV